MPRLRTILGRAALAAAVGCLVGCDVRTTVGAMLGPAAGAAKRAAATPPVKHEGVLAEERRNFRTNLPPAVPDENDGVPAPEPPTPKLRKVQFRGPLGQYAAYLSVHPEGGKRRPAIVWISGGDCNTLGEPWEPANDANDQTAAAFWKAGVVTLYPSLRGGHDNPGRREYFLGEVNDVIAAAEYLSRQPNVDPERVYLGGHSTGGTLALLVSASTDRFRAVFAFGPVDDVSGYGDDFARINMRDPQEVKLRSPIHWLHNIQRPTFVIEGTGGNIACVVTMGATKPAAPVYFFPVAGADHFTILGPSCRMLAEKIHADAANGDGALSLRDFSRPFVD